MIHDVSAWRDELVMLIRRIRSTHNSEDAMICAEQAETLVDGIVNECKERGAMLGRADLLDDLGLIARAKEPALNSWQKLALAIEARDDEPETRFADWVQKEWTARRYETLRSICPAELLAAFDETMSRLEVAEVTP